MPTTFAPAFRLLTANVLYKMSDADKVRDYKAAARDGDVVLLQEVQRSDRDLMRQAFPASEWVVYYGHASNTSPIAFRRSLFSKVNTRVVQVHKALPGVMGARFAVIVRLTHKGSGRVFEVHNTHLVPGAWNDKAFRNKAEREQVWNSGIDVVIDCIVEAVYTGIPVVGGGDYNRQLSRHKSLGTNIAGRQVAYLVPASSIDLLYAIPASAGGWKAGKQETLKRLSDHAARRVTLSLAVASPAPVKPAKPTKPATPAKPAPVASEWPKDRYGRTTHDGKVVDYYTKAALVEAERRLGYPLTIVQGSYHKGVGASAGTHDGGGTVDLLAWDHANKVRVLRELGFAAWYRPTIKGLWNEHIHAVQIGNARLAPVAARQVAAYKDGRDGLKSNRIDPTPRPNPIPVFVYPPKTPSQPSKPSKPAKPTKPATPSTAPAMAALLEARNAINLAIDALEKQS